MNQIEEHGPDSSLDKAATGAGDDAEQWTLRLYVAGQTPRSLRAVANIHKICDEKLDGRYRLEVIDLYQQPQLAQGEQIVALPSLIKRLPQPLRMIIGDMSNADHVVVGLDLQLRASP